MNPRGFQNVPPGFEVHYLLKESGLFGQTQGINKETFVTNLGRSVLFSVFRLIRVFDSTFSATQPAECSNYTVINDADRSVNYKGNVTKCDKKLEEKWYRFEGPAGDRIPESVPKQGLCGTYAPGWLQGKHPTQEEGKVQRKVCYVDAGNNCSYENQIEVLNCCGFFVYKLKGTPHCWLRYCAEKGKYQSPNQKTALFSNPE